MKLQELIDRLTALVDEDESMAEATVVLAHRPRYPLQCGLVGPVVRGTCEEDIRELREEQIPEVDVEDRVAMREELERLERENVRLVYLLEGASYVRVNGQELSPYADKSLWDEV